MNLRSHPYKAYRVSNNEWADQVPSEWEEKRVKDLFRLVTDSAPIDNNHELLSLYASIGVRPRKDLEARGNKASSTDGYWLVKKGDIVVNKLLAWMGSVGLSDYDGVTSPAYDVLRKTRPTLDERYFSYLFRTEIAKQIFKKNSRGIMDMRLRLYFDKLGAITVPVPPFSTQQAIAAYIDKRTAQIDRKIDLLSQKATQYGKLKQSLINETVTRGLDKTVAMKGSGVEWIGEVPAHWEVKRLKDLIVRNDGGVWGSDSDEANEVTLVFRSTEQTVDGEWEITNPAYRKLNLKEKQSSILIEDDLLITKSSGSTAHIGKTTIVNKTIEDLRACYSNFMQRIRLHKSQMPKLFWYMFNNILIRDQLNFLSNSTTGLANLSGATFNNLWVPIPPFSEQAAIVAYLDSKTTHIDQIVAILNTQIDKLKELRKTLINDIVTGKIKVA